MRRHRHHRRHVRRKKNPAGLELLVLGGAALAVGAFIYWKRQADVSANVAAAAATVPTLTTPASAGSQAAQIAASSPTPLPAATQAATQAIPALTVPGMGTSALSSLIGMRVPS